MKAHILEKAKIGLNLNKVFEPDLRGAPPTGTYTLEIAGVSDIKTKRTGDQYVALTCKIKKCSDPAWKDGTYHIIVTAADLLGLVFEADLVRTVKTHCGFTHIESIKEVNSEQ